jgi:heterodisulfide reductase subunit A
VYNFYIDIRTPGKTYDEFYRRILDEGIHFIRGKVAEVTDVPRFPGEEGKLIIQVEDTLAGRQLRVPVDMVILSAAMQPRADAKEVAKKFGISCSANGWFIERHPKLDPVATMTEGIFIAGVCQGPKDIPASVAQGAAAAARVLSLIGKKQVVLEPVRASINQEQCSGCRICNNLCPFNAITFIEDRAVSEINPALCQGCGTCVAACPSGAITGAHFTNQQIMAQIEGILWDVSNRHLVHEAEAVPA